MNATRFRFYSLDGAEDREAGSTDTLRSALRRASIKIITEADPIAIWACPDGLNAATLAGIVFDPRWQVRMPGAGQGQAQQTVGGRTILKPPARSVSDRAAATAMEHDNGDAT